MALAYGQSDEYSFVVRKLSQLYERRARRARGAFSQRCDASPHVLTGALARARRSKLTSVMVSLFTAHYVMRWGEHMGDTPLRCAPAFDARAVRAA